VNFLDTILHGMPDFVEALCAQTDPDLFFPERGESTNLPKSLCQSCADQAVCLDYAITTRQQVGIWGGTSGNQRRRLAEAQGIDWDAPRQPVSHTAGVPDPKQRQFSEAGLESLRATAARARAAKAAKEAA
jgi:hypothetical protein